MDPSLHVFFNAIILGDIRILMQLIKLPSRILNDCHVRRCSMLKLLPAVLAVRLFARNYLVYFLCI